ncbi:MAG TPA: hypothetical protein VFY31_10740 [Macromonas sp.]|nr:hypothetical protein [Macromonas sp.]
MKAQPVSATKTSDAVSEDSAGVGVSVAGVGDAGVVQATYRPSALPPVDPTAEGAAPGLPANAAVPDDARAVVQSALAQREALQSTRQAQAAASNAEAPSTKETRFQGELPVEIKHPEQKALEAKINDLVPNLWKASGAAVEVLIGDDAQAAAAARAEVFAQVAAALVGPGPAEASPVSADPYTAQAAGNGSSPGSVLNENA